MSNKIIIKFAVAFSVLAMLLIFLGVNYVPRSSASSSTRKNVMDPSKYAMPDYIERHLPAISNPVRNTSPDWVERHLPAVSNPVHNTAPDWIERHPPIAAKPVSYAGAEVTSVNVKIAPVFDVIGAVVSDPTGTLLKASQSGALAVPMTGTYMKIAPVFDVTGAVVSDPTGTLLSVINP